MCYMLAALLVQLNNVNILYWYLEQYQCRHTHAHTLLYVATTEA